MAVCEVATSGDLSLTADVSVHSLAVRMVELARTIAMARSLDEVLAGVTSAAQELIPGVDTAGVLVIAAGDTFESLASGGPAPA